MEEQRSDAATSSSSGIYAQRDLNATGAQPPGSVYGLGQNSYPVEDLEVHEEGAMTQLPAYGNTAGPSSRLLSFSGRRAMVVSSIITIFVTLLTGVSILFFARQAPKDSASSKASVQQDISLKDALISKVPVELQGNAQTLLVNGDVAARGALKFSNGNFITTLQTKNVSASQTLILPNSSGTLCLDSNNCNFATQIGLNQTNAAVAALQNRLGQVIIPAIPPASLVNNQVGAVTIQGTTNQISVTTTNGTITVAGPQDLAQLSSPTFAGLVLNGNLSLSGTVTLPLNCSALTNGGTLTTNGSGQVICSNDDGGAGASLTTSGGTPGTIPVFTTATNIEDSLLSQALGTVTISGALSVTGNANAATFSGNGAALTSLAAGNISSGTLSDLRLSANVSLLGATISNIELDNSSLTVTAGTGLGGGGSVALGGTTTLNIGAGNGIVVNADDISLSLEANKGLAVDVNGLSLIDCALNEILKYNGSNQWACAPDAGGSGVGDDISVNSTTATNANFLNTVASGSSTATTWSLAIGPNPDDLTIAIGNASATDAGAVTTGIQTFAGAKTFNGQIVAGAGINLGTQTLQGTTAVIDFNSFDVSSAGAVTAVGVNAGSGLLQGTGGVTVGGTVTFSSLTGGFLEVDGSGVVSVGTINLGTDTTGDYVASFVAGAGLTGDASGQGSAPTLAVGAGNGITVNANDIAVIYGSAANTAVQGNTSITVTAGTNLTGGGSITLGTGGTVTVNVTDNPTFAGDVVVQGGDLTVGTATQTGTFVLHDGDGETVTLNLPDVTTSYSLTLPAAVGASNQCLKAQNGTGALFWDNCTGGAGGGLSGSGTINQIPKFTPSGSALGDSSLSDDGSTVTVNGNVNLAVQGSSVTVGVGSSRTGSILLHNSTNNNTVSLQSAITSTSYVLKLPTAVGSANQCLKAQDGTGTLFWDACLGGGGGGGLTSIDGQTGPAVTINNATGSSNVITIDNADADGTTKGIAAFNASNFSAASGVINTIQGISTAATPQFAGLTLTGNLSIGANSIITSGATLTSAELEVLDGGITEGEVSGVITDVTAGAGLTGGAASGNATLTVASGNGGIVVNVDDITLALQANKGLEVDGNGLSLVDCALNEILKYNGSNQWACAPDAGAGGSGDNVSVNGSAAADANFLDVAATGTSASTAWTLVGASTPDDITLVIGNASATEAGTVTTGAQTFAGSKTFNNQIVSGGGISLGAQTLQGTSSVIDFTNFDVSSAGAVTAVGVNSGTGLLQSTGGLTVGGTVTLSSLASGFLEVDGSGVVSVGTINLGADTTGDYVASFTAGNGLTGDATGEGSAPTLAVGAGNGITANANDITLALQANKGLEVDLNGLSLIDCGNGEVLKYETTGNTWGCATDGTGTGDDVSVNSTGAAGANFLNAAATGSSTATSWSLNAVSNPDDITLVIGNASNTEAGAVTTGAQTFAGAKTFNGQIIAGAGIDLAAQTLQGTTGVIDFTNFDVLGNGNTTVGGTLAVQGATATVGTAALQGSLVLHDGSGETLSIRSLNQAANRIIDVPIIAANDTFCLLSLGNCFGAGTGGTLQAAYNAGNTITTTDARNLSFTLADTATDSSFLVNVAIGSTGKFAIQNNSIDTFSVSATGAVLSKNSTNSTTAFQIQNAANLAVLGVDTTSNVINVAGDILNAASQSPPAQQFGLFFDSMTATPAVSYINSGLKVATCTTFSCTDTNKFSLPSHATGFSSMIYNNDFVNHRPVVSYYTTNGDLELIRAGSTAQVLDSTGDVGHYNAIAGTTIGLPAISYYDTTNGNLKAVRCGNATCTSGNTVTTLDSTGDVGKYTSVALSASNNPAISYYDVSNGDLKVIICGNSTCSSGNITTTLDSAGDVGQYTDIAIPSDGFPVISYYDVTNTSLKMVKCGNSSCNSGNTVTTVHVGDAGVSLTVGQYSSIAIGTDNLPIISYNYSLSNCDEFSCNNTAALMVVKCGNGTCSSGNTTTTIDSQSGTDNQVSFGTHTTIAVQYTGLPAISFFDASDYFYPGRNRIKIASCSTASCTASSVHEIGMQSNIGTSSQPFGNAYLNSIVVDGTSSLNGGFDVVTGGSQRVNIDSQGRTTFTSSNLPNAFHIQNAAGTASLFSIDSTTPFNNITNPSFEANTSGWAAKGSATLSQTSAQQYYGSASLIITTTAAANDGAKYPVFMGSSSTYTLYLYAKLSSGTFSTLEIGRSDNGSTDTSCATAQTVLTGGWTRFSCTFTTGTVTAGSYIYAKQTDGTARTFFIDAVKLESGSTLNSYRESNINLGGNIISPTTFKNTSDSTTAFQIQNAASTTLFNIDTLNQKVDITSAATTTTAMQVTANSLTTGTGLAISSTSTSLTSGSVLSVSSATTGTVATNGIVSLNATGNYTSTANAGLLNVTANATTAGTVAKFSGTALTTGQILNLTSGTALTTGSALTSTGASYNPGAGNTGNLINLAFTNASTSTSGVSNVTGLNIAPTLTATGAAGTHNTYGIYLQALAGTPTGAGTQNSYGIRIDNQGKANTETSYGLYVDAQTGSTNSYAAIFNGGNVGIGTNAPTANLDIRQGTNGNTVLYAKRATDTSPTGNFMQLQDAAGADLVTISITGDLTVKNATINGTLSVNGHIITANASGTTTITAGAAACTTPTVSVSGNDTSGTITVTTGTACAGGGLLATITFANAYGAAPRIVLTPTNAGGSTLQYYNGARTTTTFTLDTNTAPTDATTYTYTYQALQ